MPHKVLLPGSAPRSRRDRVIRARRFDAIRTRDDEFDELAASPSISAMMVSPESALRHEHQPGLSSGNSFARWPSRSGKFRAHVDEESR